MRLPGPVRDDVTEALRTASAGDEITSVSAVGGGCINNGARIETDRGGRFFLKWNADAPAGMFEAEAGGLRALRRAAEGIDGEVRPRIPAPLATGGPSGEGGTPTERKAAWLLMEWIPPAPAARDSDERLGRALALLHGSTDSRPECAGVKTDPAGSLFGWHGDNWIGSLPQSNRRTASWAAFWRERRIVPQLAMARAAGHLHEEAMDRVVEAIPTLLRDARAPELLHGDLWSGNTFTTEGGAAALVDPAVYRGQGEVDLAMTELFGGFGPAFYAAYRDVRPVPPAYEDHRRALYQLYYLLVHVNLFGRGYASRSLAAARRVVAAAG